MNQQGLTVGAFEASINGKNVSLTEKKINPYYKKGFKIKERYLLTWNQRLHLNDIVKIKFHPSVKIDFLEFDADEYEQYICYEDRKHNFIMTICVKVGHDTEDKDLLEYGGLGVGDWGTEIEVALKDQETLNQVARGIGIAWTHYENFSEERYSSLLAHVDFASECQ